MRLGLADGKIAEMKDRGRQHGARPAFGDAFDQMVELAWVVDKDLFDMILPGHGDPLTRAEREAVTEAVAEEVAAMIPSLLRAAEKRVKDR